ncbi:rhodanese-like domain-containing protein [Candidatus Doolittlea endobia]|uniref:Thiosulfate sulfurtransferase GlpE n=1 Tax=Candidatus Doolittlea endobia TaxID=1778262 RepID=A0A143WSX3_9ENTR|nr:rhodanese-like domain-containing protein [Candidatus Doolittlea endobia]CUX96691.1 Thiosulfate sulfurtransferase GlpE [Candidatus Doolittlea endobia]
MQEIIQFVGNHPMLILLWIVLSGTLIFITCQSRFSKLGNITRDEAIRLINKEDAMIIDLRNQDDYRQGHIINSLNLTKEDIRCGKLGVLEKTKDKPVIIVCSIGTLSRGPAQNLIKIGFERVYILKEGISGWNKENLPLIQDK